MSTVISSSSSNCGCGKKVALQSQCTFGGKPDPTVNSSSSTWGAAGEAWGRTAGTASGIASKNVSQASSPPHATQRHKLRNLPDTVQAKVGGLPAAAYQACQLLQPAQNSAHLVGFQQAHADLHAPPLPVRHLVQPPVEVDVQQLDEPVAIVTKGQSRKWNGLGASSRAAS